MEKINDTVFIEAKGLSIGFKVENGVLRACGRVTFSICRCT